jgi:hypothetical protein
MISFRRNAGDERIIIPNNSSDLFPFVCWTTLALWKSDSKSLTTSHELEALILIATMLTLNFTLQVNFNQKGAKTLWYRIHTRQDLVSNFAVRGDKSFHQNHISRRRTSSGRPPLWSNPSLIGIREQYKFSVRPYSPADGSLNIIIYSADFLQNAK